MNPSLSRRSALRLLAATSTGAALGLSGCAQGSTGSAPGTSASSSTPADASLVVQLPWILNSQFIGEYLAVENGHFGDVGITSVQLVPGPSSGVTEVLSGTAGVALTDAVAVGAVIAEQQAPVKIIGAAYQKNPFSVLSLADAGNITSPAELVGKRIGVQDSNRALFSALVQANGLNPNSITVVPVQYDASPLLQGEVDGYISFLTSESIIVARQGHRTTDMAFATHGLPFVADAFIATDEMIASQPALLKAFLEAEIRGYTDALADPQVGVDLAVDDYGKDLDLDRDTELACAVAANEQLVVSDETRANGLFTISDELQAQTLASLATSGIAVTGEQLFDLSLLTSLLTEKPELRSLGA